MKLVEALEILRDERSALVQKLRLYLACGFTPLHLPTFLAAQLRILLPQQQVEFHAGLYGDFWGNLEKAERARTDTAIVVMEWGDLDPRLGLRSLGSWSPDVFPDILSQAKIRTDQFRELIQKIASEVPVVICFPTLPLPPVSFSVSGQSTAFDLQIRACVADLSVEVSRVKGVRVLNAQRLDTLSPLNSRLDLKSELVSGFPYKLSHASTMAELLTKLVQRPTPKKGLITDLDDTLWSGILGESGEHGISWDLEHNSHIHGLYQRFLQALSQSGVLIAAASKNDPVVVEKAFQRKDLILSQTALFPIDAHWGAKSESVSRIVKTWNIGADSIVFIDDSPMELAEVKTVHPDVECILFPKNDYQAMYELMYRLRDLFGKDTVTTEDTIRQESIRRAHTHAEHGENHPGTPEQFLEQAEAELTIELSKESVDGRALELINKTNQFNLNGKRHTESSWRTYLKEPDTIVMVVAYQDKYGPLGKIAVLAGRIKGSFLSLDTWVMSCRAFSRRIEHKSLEELFERFHLETISFDFQTTAKNSPVRDFLTEILGTAPSEGSRLSRDELIRRQVRTFHKVMEAPRG
ncbi:MAG: HAD-IIIC family phosphatase [Acidobacteriia bacterium]|nr:HAD-IIIC family phosphatase [Terriglobia bacterium]